MKREIKIGETPLFELKNIGESVQYRFRKAYVKDESKNPFGTVKDRRNFYIFQEANRLRVDKLVLITSGNSGYSLAQFAKGSTVKVVCIVSKTIAQEIRLALQDVAYQVIELNLQHKILRPEELITFAREKDDEVIWEVTNGYEENYQGIIEEILREVTPDYIVVPVGSGGIYLGIIQGLERRHAKTKVIGIGVQNTIHSLADKLSTPWTPYAKALEHYHNLGNTIYRLTEQEVKKTFSTFKNIMTCEPSSSIVFAACEKHTFKPDDIVVFLNSGKSQVA